jgi:hypothetical protein
VPSRLDRVIWSNTFGDIQTKVRLKIQLELAKSHQQYENLAKVVVLALGGKPSEGSSHQDKPKPVETWDELVAAFGGVFN